MKIQFIKGHFSSKEAIDMMTLIVHAKIKFLENKISVNNNEEVIKMRENRIKSLQKDLFEFRSYVEKQTDSISITSEINLA